MVFSQEDKVLIKNVATVIGLLSKEVCLSFQTQTSLCRF